MYRQSIWRIQLTFVLVLYMRLLSESHAATDVCSICSCQRSQTYIYCQSKGLTSVPQPIPQTVKYLYLGDNDIKEIKAETFRNLSSLTYLNLNGNNIQKIENDTFKTLVNLQTLNLYGNNIQKIEDDTFKDLVNLQTLYLSNNQIKNYEDGAFLFLPSLTYIDLENNNELECQCHLPVFVNYINKTFNRIVDVKGVCRTDLSNNQSKVIPIQEYSQCKNYLLFQPNLQCETCSGIMCKDPNVTICTGAEPVCRNTLSMNGVKQKFEKSCSTYKECVDALGNNTFTCNKWTSGISCVTCCTGNLCNTNDFIGFVFHLIYNSTFKKFNEYQSSAENISRAMEHELSTLTGTFQVEYCGLEEHVEIFTINCTVPVKINKDQLFKMIFETFYTSLTLRNLGIQQRNMELIDEMFCNENTTSTDKDIFYWPMAKIGTKVTIPCHANIATRYCSSRTAVGLKMPLKCSPFTGTWQQPDMSQCYNTEGITQQLKNITSEDIDKENVKEISKRLLDVSQKSVYFKEEDIVLAVGIQEKMVPLISNVADNITAINMILSINNMINTPEKILVEAEQSNRTVTRMLDIIETIAEKIPLEQQQYTVVYSNLGIGVIKVEKDTFNGVSYIVFYGNNETEAKTTIYDNSNPSQVTDMLDFISLPNYLLKDLKNEERSTISRISFFSMQDDKLYRVINNSSTKANTKINSHIIAANIPKVQITNLDEPVTIIFNLIDPRATKPQCVYWEKSPGQNPHWSTKGCKTTKYVPGEKVFCSCNHLTSFALLMDVYQEEVGKDFQLLSITSNIGCGISSVVLIMTVLVYLCSKNLRKLLASKILVNLCISLAVTNLIFLVGMQEYTTRPTAVCKALAALLHYFLLTSLMWMAVEALHVFLAVVDVFKTYQTHFMMKSSILAWGLPAVIVAITLAINYTNNYIRISKVCWLSKIPFYAAFLAPVVTILIFNLTMFSIIIWRLISIQSNKTLEHETRRIRVLGIFVLFSLFGISWTFAFFAVDNDSDVFTFLFGIFNTLQGMFIFVFYCIYKKDARDVICLCLCKKQKKGNTRKAVKASKSSSSDNEAQNETNI